MPNINDWLTYNGSEYEINGTTYRNLEAQVKRNQQVSIYAQQLSDNNNTQIEAFREELADYDLLDGYVTPQVYGAIADGVTDCTPYIQQAVDSGKHVLFPAGEYAMAGTVTFYDKAKFVFDASAANITYTGTSYAFEIIKCENCFLKFGGLNTTSGGCIHFSVDGNTINPDFTETITGSVGTQYINIDFITMGCNDSDIVYDMTDPDNPVYLYNKYSCIHGVQDNNGTSNWCNEIRFSTGRFMRGQAVHLIQKEAISNGRFNSWKFFRVGFEGYTAHKVKGFRLDASSASTVKSGYSFIDCRNEADDVDYIMDFTADGYDCKVNGVYVYGPIRTSQTQYKFTSQTFGSIIGSYVPATSYVQFSECRIVNGYIIPNNWSARFYTYSNSDLTSKLPYQLNDLIYVNNAAVTSLVLPNYYFLRNGGINEFYIKFQHNKTNFEISVSRAGTVTHAVTIPSVTAWDTWKITWIPQSTSSDAFDSNNADIYKRADLLLVQKVATQADYLS